MKDHISDNFAAPHAASSQFKLGPEHDGLGVIEQDSVLEKQGNGSRKYAALDVSTFLYQHHWPVCMSYALNILFDDRSFVEVLRDKMGSSPN